MPPRGHLVDASLFDWSDIADRYGNALLIGNGASVNVSARFSYPSLFDAATLRQRDQDLFESLDTTNFERVLTDLHTGAIVCNNAGHSTRRIESQYGRIRSSLVETVASVHVDWNEMPERTLLRIRRALSEYNVVVSTNYDLLTYWTIMAKDPVDDFVDYFWGTNNTFDITRSEAWRDRTRVLYLHGGLHLVRETNGAARKRRALSRNLLESFRRATDVPLFVSEGTSRDKLTSIRGSDYLTFAFQTLIDNVDGLVVFGHSLGKQDEHIGNALAGSRRLAISIRPGARDEIIAEKARYVHVLPRVRIQFFDSTTHPLDKRALTIP